MAAKLNSIILIAVCTFALVYPTLSVSRWFSATYADLHVTLRRYGHCVSSLEPLSEPNLNQTDYLIKQMRLFLDEANLDNEQLANVSSLMDSICIRSDAEAYPISVHLDVEKFSNAKNGSNVGKMLRCKGLDQVMDNMYVAFKRSALNKTEPLDFTGIKFYTDPAKQNYFTVIDLINTIWIKSEAHLELVCRITDSVKTYVQQRSAKLKIENRAQRPSGVTSYMADIINSILDSLLGLQKRLYWESTNRYEQLWSRLSSMFTSANTTTKAGVSNKTVVVSTTPLPRAPATVTPQVLSTTQAPLNSNLTQL